MPLDKTILDRTLASPHGEAAYQIVEKLTDAGFDAWWVGGAVRDMLQGNVPHDIDIATDAHPDDIVRIFPKSDDAARQFGSILVSEKGHVFEVTTFREDDEASDGRHPETVVFGDRAHDAKRRDLTINAIYFHPLSRELFDPYEGENDLKERLIRFIGDPALRIKHDALRMLRTIRFRALLDGQYHPETYRALIELKDHIRVLSGGRILEELEKILMGPHPSRALEDLWETHILHEILPELAVCKGIAQPADYHHEGDVWEHILKLLSSFAEEQGIDVRLAGLFHDCGKADTFSRKERIRFDHHAEVGAVKTKAVLDRLQCPAKRRDKICWLIEHHMMMGTFEDLSVERKAHWYFHPWFIELLQLFWLDIAGTDPSDSSLYNKIVQDYDLFLNENPKPTKPLLSGEEVMQITGLKPGEKIGKILQLLHNAQVQKKVTTKKEATKFLYDHFKGE